MKGADATRLDQKPAPVSDRKSMEIRASCIASDPRVLAARSSLQQAQGDASAAADAVVKEKDPNKIEDDKKIADSKKVLANAARDKADAAIGIVSTGGSTYALNFYLDPSLVSRSDTRDAWIKLLRKPWNTMAVAVSVGTESNAWPSQETIPFERISRAGLIAWAVLFVVAITVFVGFARNSDIIRDAGQLSTAVEAGHGAEGSAGTGADGAPVAGAGAGAPGVGGGAGGAAGASTGGATGTGIAAGVSGALAAVKGVDVPPAKRKVWKTYSLGRTQMAVWTFVVAGAMAFIFLVTWNENAITTGVLELLGLSFGTTLLAAVADGTQPSPQESKGFLNDLLSDGDGPSFHRYQMVLFTVILVVIFVTKVATNMAMPEFDATLLGLMGISNGTYIGFKLQNR